MEITISYATVEEIGLFVEKGQLLLTVGPSVRVQMPIEANHLERCKKLVTQIDNTLNNIAEVTT